MDELTITLLVHQIASIADKLGILDEIKYRDFCIQEEFKAMKLLDKNSSQIETELGKKYSLSVDRIHKIIYKNGLGS